jgi:predicted TPR repeat methyltransferase
MTEPEFFSSPDLAICPEAEGYLVYHLATGKLHRLNPTASLILELCEKGRTREVLVAALADLPGAASAAVPQWLDFALREQLLVGSRPAAAALHSASDYADTADALRQDGEILAAYVCQDHATALEPSPPNWRARGNLAHILGRRDDARYSFEQYLTLRPDSAEIRHLLSALRDQPPPQRAPDDCIQQLYSRFSGFYEHNMCEQLLYQAPERLKETLDLVLGPTGALDVLELGCGTGLAAKYLRPLARFLTGIDLSPEMVEKASATQLYDVLAVAEITDHLARQTLALDLIVACDTLIYFGDLAQITQPAVRLLRPGGYLVFTVEKGEQAPFKLMDSGRYSHTEQHIRAVAAAAGLTVVSVAEGFLRKEYGEPVTGLIAALRRP